MLQVRQPHTEHRSRDTEIETQGKEEDDTLQLFHKGTVKKFMILIDVETIIGILAVLFTIQGPV